MPRKRDFVLFGLVIIFLVVGIVSTTTWQNLAGLFSNTTREIKMSEAVERTGIQGEMIDETALRQERLERLKGRLASETETIVSAPPASEVVIPPQPTPTSTTDSVQPALQCASPRTVQVDWDPRSLRVQESEGALIVYRIRATLGPVTTTTLDGVGAKEVVLQMTLRSLPQQAECITTDVIGIAMDGSLIRNNERALYAIFGAETQIGYSLDGFPIFGVATSDESIDACGGKVVNGTYRYFVQSTDDSLLSCFVAPPIAL